MVKVSKCADCGDSLSVCLAGTLCPASMREMWRGVCGDLGRGEGREDRLTGAEHGSGAKPLHGAWNRRGTVDDHYKARKVPWLVHRMGDSDSTKEQLAPSINERGGSWLYEDCIRT